MTLNDITFHLAGFLSNVNIIFEDEPQKKGQPVQETYCFVSDICLLISELIYFAIQCMAGSIRVGVCAILLLRLIQL